MEDERVTSELLAMQAPQAPSEELGPVSDSLSTEAFAEPRAWAVKWCGYALFGSTPSGVPAEFGAVES